MLRRRLVARLARVPAAAPLARLTVETIRVCLRYRVTGLASEAAFFMLLSLPPLLRSVGPCRPRSEGPRSMGP